MGIVILLLPIAAILSYCWLVQHSKYWQRRGVSGPKSVPLFGNLRSMGSAMDPRYLRSIHEWSKQYGKAYGIQRGLWNALVVSDPQMAREVFVDRFEDFNERDHAPLMNSRRSPRSSSFLSGGVRWKRMRTLVNPIFSTQSVRQFVPVVNESAARIVDEIERRASLEPNKSLQPIQFFNNFNIHSIMGLMIGANDDSITCQNVYNVIRRIMTQLSDGYFYYSWLLPFGRFVLQFCQMTQTFFFNIGFIKFIRLLYREAHQRRLEQKAEPDKQPSDILGHLVRFVSNEPVNDYHVSTENLRAFQVVKSSTLDEACSQAAMFLFAGFETVANTMAFISYRLALNPHVQERLRDEINSVIGDGKPTYEKLCALSYADAVIKETLRMHPVGMIVTSRRAVRKTQIGSIEIEADTDVIVDVLALHYDREFWGDDVNEFRPERWLNSEPPMQFLGFGIGPRSCVGVRLAMVQQKAVICEYLRRFRLDATSPIDPFKGCVYPNAATIRFDLL